ncbi:MAG: response regulator [Chitinispirillales bacterium]|nr:response regulator [Chitinispirillales bacterium]
MDIEQSNSERQLYISQKLDIVGQLAGGISHNFNNQLTGIMGFANLISMRSGDDNIKKFADEILGICKNAGDMVRELLTFARYKPVATADIDVHGIITTITNLLANSIDKRIVIEHKLSAEHCAVVADAIQLQSALLNLALNSKDAMPKGGVITFTTSNIVDGNGGCFVKIEVADTGSGFGGDVEPHLFEPFFTTKGQGHVGLGLSAVYRFVKSMNGVIEVSSTEGRGTSVVLLLPVYAAAADVAEICRTSTGGTKRVEGGTILLVDDDKGIRDSISAFLKGLGYIVITASDGLEAVEGYTDTYAGVDLVIMDMVMPRMGGKEAFVKMRAINPAIRAVGITGFTKHTAEEMTALGMKRILHKPFSFDELSSVVTEYI